jgi:hypothetical protein
VIVAVDPQLRPLPRRDVQVGGAPLDHLLEERAEVEDCGRLRFCAARPAAGIGGRGRLIGVIALGNSASWMRARARRTLHEE